MNGNANDSRDSRDLCLSNVASGGPTTDGHKNSWTSNGELGTATNGINGKTTRSTTDGKQCAQDTSKGPHVNRPKLLILSAADEDGISRQARSIQRTLDRVRNGDRKDELLGDVVFNLNNRRSMLEWKAFSVLHPISVPSDLTESLSTPYQTSNSPNNIGLIFTGQGAQWSRMGWELLEWPVFKSSLTCSQKHLASFGVTWNLFGGFLYQQASAYTNGPF